MTSGTSPLRTSTGSSPRCAAAACTAPPVPLGSGWIASSTPSGRRPSSGRCGPSTTTTLPAPAASAAATGHAIIGCPQRSCRTLGVRERMRVPWPAARMTTVGAVTGRMLEADRAAPTAPRAVVEGRDVDGRVAVVTGAGRGLGAAIADELAAQGAAVVVADRDEELARATAERPARRRPGGHAAGGRRLRSRAGDRAVRRGGRRARPPRRPRQQRRRRRGRAVARSWPSTSGRARSRSTSPGPSCAPRPRPATCSPPAAA